MTLPQKPYSVINSSQMTVAVIFLTILLLLLVISLLVLLKKSETANLRGQSLIGLMIFMHCISLGYPNLLTVLGYYDRFYFPSFAYFNLVVDIFATLMITLLIFIRAIFLYKKANNEVVSNLRGVILTVALFNGSIYVFVMLCFRPFLPHSEYKILQIQKHFIYLYAVDMQGLTVLGFFFASFLLVNGLKKWGVYFEMMILCALKLGDMMVSGLILIFLDKVFWAQELHMNLYRTLLMIANCFFFILFFDEMDQKCELNIEMDILKVSSWDPQITSTFLNYLQHNDHDEIVSFFDSKISKNQQIWTLLKLSQGTFQKKMMTSSIS